jgi:response regulator RpfG family c-di-GMP phosphodiesterase
LIAKTREEKLQRIIQIEKKLGEIQDVDVLLERLLTEARHIVSADAGSIYITEDDKLRIKYAQNDTNLKKLAPGSKSPYISFSFPINEKSISGYVAKTMEPLNIPDVYTISSEAPYKFDKRTDEKTQYHTESMFTLPLKTASNRLLGVLQIINAKDSKGYVTGFDKDAELFITHFASNATQALEHAYLTSNMIKRMLKMAEFRDPKETSPHVERVSNFALEIYDRYAFNHTVSDEERHKFRDRLKIAAKCHDVGKVGISDVVLKKTYPRFSAEERAVMQGHTCIGANLFEPAEDPLDAMSRNVALYHHEFWNGDSRGYPGRMDYKMYEIGTPVKKGLPLKGKEIPLEARIVAVADVFDALSHKRCYKDAWTSNDAFTEIESLSGKQFDPEVVSAFLQVKDRISAIQNAYKDD